VGHVNSLLRPAVKNFARRTAPNQPSFPSGSITEVSELAPQLCTAHIHASWAALERDQLLYSVFQVALEHYDRAWKLFEEKGSNGRRMDFALLVADRVLNHGLAIKQLDSVLSSAGAYPNVQRRGV
jgi:hypothetical protein